MKRHLKAKNFMIVLSISMIVIILCLFLYAFVGTYDVKLEENKLIKQNFNAVFLDDDNNNIKPSIGETYVSYKDISPNLIDAFVAIEDKRFFDHYGIDYYRLAGAVLKNIKAGYFKEGGSTITQQLAKNTQLTFEKTFNRKLKEAKLSYLIEKNFSKEDIIAMYLNAIYFGNGLYGINSASNKLFNKSPLELNIAESAILAGIVKNPKKNSPIINPKSSKERMNLVLKVMLDLNKISKQDYDSAMCYEFDISKMGKTDIFNSYLEATIDEASTILGKSEKELLSAGYQIKTYFNKELQSQLERISLTNDIESLVSDKMFMISDNRSSGVAAYYSSFKTPISNFRRSPASTIKPILVYAPAIDSNYITALTPVLDERQDFDGYSPKNYGDSYYGWTDYRNSIMHSLNTPAVRLFNEMKVDYCKKYASNMGLSFDSRDNNLALALGGMTKGVTPIELSRAYMTLANGGKSNNLRFVKEIISPEGKKIFENRKDDVQVIKPSTAYLLTDTLVDTAKYGTGKKLSSLPYDVACKTGTNAGKDNKNLDSWNMSYSTDYTVAIWLGSEDNSQAKLLDKSITGGSIPTIIAKNIYENLPTPNRSFDVPEDVIEFEYDDYVRDINKILTIASENTPEQFRKTGLVAVDFDLPISTLFDKLLEGSQIFVTRIDDVVEIKLVSNNAYGYKCKIFKEINGVALEIASSDDYLSPLIALDIAEVSELGHQSKRYFGRIYDKNDKLLIETSKVGIGLGNYNNFGFGNSIFN